MITDMYGAEWPDSYELCPVCKQPDNCGDCNHHRLSDEEVVELGGIPTGNDKWFDNSIQFPRLICEIVANVDISTAEWNALCESMDIDSTELDDLFERANREWDRIKAQA